MDSCIERETTTLVALVSRLKIAALHLTI